MQSVSAFRKKVLAYHATYGRHTLPWRKTSDPYKILVSEIMLQQTQVERVIPRYTAFIKKFPNVQSLSNASLGDVLTLWVGLGYNRRAKYLYEAARSIHVHHAEVFPKTVAELQSLPGVGAYTAGAVAAFAYNTPVAIIETNIRTVLLHHFYDSAGIRTISDAELLLLAKRVLPKQHIRTWYYALMDYGVYIKKTYGSNNHQSKHYTTQSTFNGSDRQVRGSIIKVLSSTRLPLSLAILKKQCEYSAASQLNAQLTALYTEGLIEKQGTKYRLAT